METKRYLEAMEKIMKKYYPDCRYSFTGYQEESICMQSVQAGWIVYNAERGNHYEEISCDTVLMACLVFFRKVTSRAEDVSLLENELVRQLAKYVA